MTPQNESSDENSAGLFGDLASMIGSRPEHSVQRRFGDYDLLGKLGEGGMGVVYLARQRGLDRLVALKMPPLALAQNEMAVARFKRETEALSRCEHPNVVKILSTGEEGGVPYYAMEYIEGADLAKVARALSTNDDFDAAVTTASDQVKKERSELFDGLPTLMRRFAEGDAAKNNPASAKRETKSRVRRLAEIFRDAARGLHHLHERGVIHRDISPGNLMVTANDHRVLVMDLGLATLTDASQSLTKDKAAILGKLRYMSPEQLQAGSAALDRRADVYSLGASLYELLTDQPFFDGDSSERLMKQVMFEKPVPPEKAKPGLPKDLALIVSTATEKEVSRRYSTAQDFADDLDRWLNGEAIRARPPTVGYIVKLAINRNKALFVGTVAALSACVAMAVFFTVREREVLKQRLETETNLKNDAITQKQKAEQISKFLKDMLKGVGPSVAMGRDTKMLREILDKTVERIEKEFKDQLEVTAELRTTIGEVYIELGEFEKAKTIFSAAVKFRRQSFKGGKLDLAVSLDGLGQALYNLDELPDAEATHREALAIRQVLLGQEHQDVAESLTNLANVIMKKAEINNSEDMYQEAFNMYKNSLNMRRSLLGNEHPKIAESLNNIALSYIQKKDFDKAEAALREALAMNRKLLGNVHPDIAYLLGSLAEVLKKSDKLVEAEASFREAIEVSNKLQCHDHLFVARWYESIAICLMAQSNLTKAVAVEREALEIYRKLVSNEHPWVTGALINLAKLLQKKGDYIDAVGVAREASELDAKRAGKDSWEASISQSALIYSMLGASQFVQAEPIARECLSIRERLLPGDWRVFSTKSMLGECLLGQKKYTEAELLLITGYEGMKQREKTIPDAGKKNLNEAAARLQRLYEETGRTEKAAEWKKFATPTDK